MTRKHHRKLTPRRAVEAASVRQAWPLIEVWPAHSVFQWGMAKVAIHQARLRAHGAAAVITTDHHPLAVKFTREFYANDTLPTSFAATRSEWRSLKDWLMRRSMLLDLPVELPLPDMFLGIPVTIVDDEVKL